MGQVNLSTAAALCPRCGPLYFADSAGNCPTCGALAVGEGATRVLDQLREVKHKVGQLLHSNIAMPPIKPEVLAEMTQQLAPRMLHVLPRWYEAAAREPELINRRVTAFISPSGRERQDEYKFILVSECHSCCGTGVVEGTIHGCDTCSGAGVTYG